MTIATELRAHLSALLKARDHAVIGDRRCTEFQAYKRTACDFITAYGDELEAILTRTEAAQVGDGAVAHIHDYGDRVRVVWDSPWGDFPVGTRFYTHPQDASAVTGRVNGYMFSARAIEIITDGEIPEWISKSPGLRVAVAAMSATKGEG